MLKKIIEKIKKKLDIAEDNPEIEKENRNDFRIYERNDIFSDYSETEKAPKAIVFLMVFLLVVPVICMFLCFATLLCIFKLMLMPRWYLLTLLLC